MVWELESVLVGDLSLGESARGATPSSLPGEQLDRISAMELETSCLDFFLASLSSSNTVNIGLFTERERPMEAALIGLARVGIFLCLRPSGLSASLNGLLLPGERIACCPMGMFSLLDWSLGTDK